VGVLVHLLGATPQPFVQWPLRRRLLLTAALLMPLLLLHGHRSQAESWIAYFARTRLRSLVGCHRLHDHAK
jgi:hypothetical protein